MWERDHETLKIKYPATKCEWINDLKTAEQEAAEFNERFREQMRE